MDNRWVAAILAVCGGVILFWSWQSFQDQQRLARELTITQSALTRLRERNAAIEEQLTQIQAAMERLQSQEGQLTSKLTAAHEQWAAAELARERAEAQLQALEAQEELWLAEREQLTQRIAALEQEKVALEQRLEALRAAGSPGADRLVPPTAGKSITAGNRGYLVRDGQPTDGGTRTRVEVRPAAVIQGDALTSPAP